MRPFLLRAAPSIARASIWRLRPPTLAASRLRPLCTPAAERITITFVEAGEDVVVEAQVGKSILEVAQENEIDLEGACDGSRAGSTCHVVFEQKHFDVLPKPEEEEEDMLDLAFGLTDTSRLGCQIKVRARHTQTARTPRSRADPNPRRCRPAPVAGRTVARRHEAHHPGLRLRRGGARKRRLLAALIAPNGAPLARGRWRGARLVDSSDERARACTRPRARTDTAPSSRSPRTTPERHTVAEWGL